MSWIMKDILHLLKYFFLALLLFFFFFVFRLKVDGKCNFKSHAIIAGYYIRLPPHILFIFLYLYFNIRRKKIAEMKRSEIYEIISLDRFSFISLLKFNLFFNCLFIFEFGKKRNCGNPFALNRARNEHLYSCKRSRGWSIHTTRHSSRQSEFRRVGWRDLKNRRKNRIKYEIWHFTLDEQPRRTIFSIRHLRSQHAGRVDSRGHG